MTMHGHQFYCNFCKQWVPYDFGEFGEYRQAIAEARRKHAEASCLTPERVAERLETLADLDHELDDWYTL